METFRGPQLVQGQRIGTDFTSRSSGRGTLSQSYRSAMQGASARNVRVQCTASDCGALLEVESPTNRSARRPERAGKEVQHSRGRHSSSGWMGGVSAASWRTHSSSTSHSTLLAHHAAPLRQPFAARPASRVATAMQHVCHTFAVVVQKLSAQLGNTMLHA